MNPTFAYIQSGLLVVVIGILKFLVVDKLKQITDALDSHEKRLRAQENVSAFLRGKGCLGGDACPLGSGPEGGEEDK